MGTKQAATMAGVIERNLVVSSFGFVPELPELIFIEGSQLKVHRPCVNKDECAVSPMSSILFSFLVSPCLEGRLSINGSGGAALLHTGCLQMA